MMDLAVEHTARWLDGPRLVNRPGPLNRDRRPLFTGLPLAPAELAGALAGELSEADLFALVDGEARDRALAALSDGDMAALAYDWRFWARPKQIAPAGDWRVLLFLAGRGWGKTRTGAEWVIEQVQLGKRRIALVAPTAADAREVMVGDGESPSGILQASPPWNRPVYEPSKRRLTWPNGAVATTYSAEEPERLRGPQHDAAWCDELCAWAYPDAWDQLMFGLRIGQDPRAVVTTTPRPVELLIGTGRDGRRLGLLKDPTVRIVFGRTEENRGNLAPVFLAQITQRYAGTRLGRQELEAEVLEDVAGALWDRKTIDGSRLLGGHPDLVRIVVAIDPAATSGAESDETGIVVAGKDAGGHGYVLADGSGRYAPTEWARTAIKALRDHAADRIVAEVNNGGEMVEATIRMVDPDAPFTAVRASRGKVTRAEPVAALYEQGRIHHCGAFDQLEDQMCAFTGDFDRGSAGYSPDRVDALVWAITELMVAQRAPLVFGTL